MTVIQCSDAIQIDTGRGKCDDYHMDIEITKICLFKVKNMAWSFLTYKITFSTFNYWVLIFETNIFIKKGDSIYDMNILWYKTFRPGKRVLRFLIMLDSLQLSTKGWRTQRSRGALVLEEIGSEGNRKASKGRNFQSSTNNMRLSHSQTVVNQIGILMGIVTDNDRANQGKQGWKRIKHTGYE